MVTRYTNFTAWFYEIPFTQQQREKIRAILLRDWKKPEEIKNDVSWLTMAADFAKIMKRALSQKSATLAPDGRSLEVEPQIRF
jgi:hypothetical protein